MHVPSAHEPLHINMRLPSDGSWGATTLRAHHCNLTALLPLATAQREAEWHTTENCKTLEGCGGGAEGGGDAECEVEEDAQEEVE
eukprot:15386032-Alexandrium_andersonii.AAC.1